MDNKKINEDVGTSSGNKGNRGKFSDRIKKIRMDRLKFRKHALPEEENILKRGGRNFLKIVLATPSVVYSTIKSSKDEVLFNEKNDDKQARKRIINKNVVVSAEDDIFKDFDKRDSFVDADVINDNDFDNKNYSSRISSDIRRVKVSKIRDIDISSLKKQCLINLKNKSKTVSNGMDLPNSNVSNKAQVDDRERIEKLQKEIIDLIKKKLIKNVNELELLQSELYLLKEIKGDDLHLKECEENIKEIKKLLSKIKSLKEKYDYLKDNIDFEYMLEFGDDLLIDKILELKDLCSSDDIRKVVSDYRILEEYKYLYLKIDKLQEDSIEYENYKNEQVLELKNRDIDFEKLKNDVYDVDRDNDRYDNFVREQEILLRDLDSKILNIDSHERVSYRLKGFSQLVGNSFKYMGLLLLNPLKGLLPGIATQTIITKNVVHNLYNNLEWEEKIKMVYEAVDYSTSIKIAINNIDEMASMINTTLDDVIKLKNKFEEDFSKYQYSFPNYRDTLKKINKMENAIMNNKIKIEMMQLKMKIKEKQNADKLKRVKKLNSSSDR